MTERFPISKKNNLSIASGEMKSLYIKLVQLFTMINLIIIANANAQSWQWANHLGSSDYDFGTFCLDSSGNSYLTGRFCGPYGIFGNDTIHITGYPGAATDIFITKIDSSGNFIWSKRAGGYDQQYSTGEMGRDILYESTTNSIIFCGVTDADDDSIGACTMGGGNSFFLSKLDTGGNCQWAISGGSVFGIPQVSKIVLDDNGHVYMLGYFSYQTYIDQMNLSKGQYILKFNSSDGSCVWAKKIMEYADLSLPLDISYHSNKLYLAGITENDTLVLDTATVYGFQSDVFVSEFDTAGIVQWVKTMGGSKSDNSGSLDVDSNGDIYITGSFEDTAYFESEMLSNGNHLDWFLAKYNSVGDLIWTKQAHISGDLYEGNTVSVDENGNVFVAGNFSGSAIFGLDTINSFTSLDLFIARYNSNGDCLGVKHVGNAARNQEILPDNAGGCYVAGAFKDTMNFDNHSIVSYGQSDFFLAKIGSNFTTSVVIQTRMASNELFIYANPTSGKCNITIPYEFSNDNQLILIVFDNVGKLVQQSTLEMNGDKIKLNLEAQAKGIYNVSLSNGKKSYSGRIVFE